MVVRHEGAAAVVDVLLHQRGVRVVGVVPFAREEAHVVLVQVSERIPEVRVGFGVAAARPPLPTTV